MTPDPSRLPEPLTKARLRLWLKLLKATNGIEAELRRRLRDDFGSTLPRFDVMSALSRHPEGLKMSEISTLLKVSNGNVTGIVERLVEDRLALRVAVPGDRRAQMVRLTPLGQETFARQAATHERWIGEMLSGMEAADLRALSSMLDRILPATETRE